MNTTIIIPDLSDEPIPYVNEEAITNIINEKIIVSIPNTIDNLLCLLNSTLSQNQSNSVLTIEDFDSFFFLLNKNLDFFGLDSFCSKI